MFSLSQRFQNITSTITTAIMIAAALISAQSYITLYNTPLTAASVTIQNSVNSLKNTRNYGGSRNQPKENTKLKFNIVADFTPLFNWNTKQVFTYLYIEYPTSENEKTDDNDNKVVVWDKILTDGQGYINFRNLKSKYSVWDYAPQLSNREGQLKLGYNVQPYIGGLYWGELDLNETFTFPELRL